MNERILLVEDEAGLRVTLTRTVKKDGEVVRREVVSRSYYRPYSGIVRIGTASAPAKKADKPTATEPSTDEKAAPAKPVDDSGSDA